MDELIVGLNLFKTYRRDSAF